MLFSSRVAAAEDRHAPRVGREEQRRLARPSCRRRRCGRRARGCSTPRCARRRRRCPCRRGGRTPRSAGCRHETPQARMIVRACRTSPPSRCTWRVAASIRVIDAGDEDLGAEPARLLQRAARELVARHARREAEVVLDPRRRAGLAARRLPLDHDRREPLRRAVHRGREPGGPGADDHRVVLRGGGLRGEAEQLGHPAQLRPHHGLAVDDADHGAIVVGRQRRRPTGSAASGASGVIHRERDLVAVEEAPQLRARRRPSGGRRRSRAAAADRRRCPAGRRSAVRARAAELHGDLGRRGRDRVVVARLDPHHARRLGRAEPERERRRRARSAPRRRGRPLARPPTTRSIPSTSFDRLQPALEHREQRPLVARVDRVLAGHEPDVRREPGEPLALAAIERGEDRDGADLLRRHHRRTPVPARCAPSATPSTLPHRVDAAPGSRRCQGRPRSAGPAPAISRRFPPSLVV